MGNGSYNFLLVTHIVSDPFHVSSQTHQDINLTCKNSGDAVQGI